MAFNYAKEDVAKSAVVNVEDATTKIKELIIKGVNSGVAKEQILDDTKRIIAYCIKNIDHIKDKEIVMRSLWNNANQVLYEYTRAVKVFSTNAYNRAVDLGFMNGAYSYDGKVIDKIRNLIDSEKKDMINPIIEDYQKKIRSTIRVLSAEAPFAVETTPSGHTSKMGIRVRAEMKVRYETNMAELERYKTEGVKLVWITSHPNCSPRCTDYQGKLYSLDGTRGNINSIKYEPIEEALAGPYGDGNGCISGYNCRHRLVEYKEGSKAPIEYTEYEIKRAYAIDKQQRSIEGDIRQLKVEEKLLRASGNNAAAKVLRLKWRELTKGYEAFCLTNKRPISRWRCVVAKEELEKDKSLRGADEFAIKGVDNLKNEILLAFYDNKNISLTSERKAHIFESHPELTLDDLNNVISYINNADIVMIDDGMLRSGEPRKDSFNIIKQVGDIFMHISIRMCNDLSKDNTIISMRKMSEKQMKRLIEKNSDKIIDKNMVL